MKIQLKSKRSIPVVLMAIPIIAMALLMSPVQAFSADSEVGDVYMVSTIKGKAWARIDGEIVAVPVTIELTCKVTEEFHNIVLFKPVRGNIVLNGTVYQVNQAWWRGIYYRCSERALIQGSASDSEGNTLYFILHTKDRAYTQGGTFMNAVGGMRDPNGVYWRTELLLWRYKFN